MSKPAMFSRTIWLLCLVSLFNDFGSEMLIPVMPVYLQSIGFSVLLIGILEGLAEAIAGLSKGYFGNLSDLKGKRMPFVQVGYLMSALAKPVMGLFTNAWWVFAARTTDRLGKGVRTAARDALLSDESTPEIKGRVFGLHRAFDTIGAVCGPLVALVFLHFYPGKYQWLFMLAFFPGLFTIALTLMVREKTSPIKPVTAKPGIFSFVSYWKSGPADYRLLVSGLLLFALFNSSDAFLLLKVKESGYSDQAVIGIYILYNLVYAIAAYPFGKLADHFGLKKVYITGLIFFVIAYAGIGFSDNTGMYVSVFIVYGLFAAATEGVSKAWITNITPASQTATAIGAYTAFQSLAALIASSLAGLVWFKFGNIYVFVLSATAAAIAAIYLMMVSPGAGSKSPA